MCVCVWGGNLKKPLVQNHMFLQVLTQCSSKKFFFITILFIVIQKVSFLPPPFHFFLNKRQYESNCSDLPGLKSKLAEVFFSFSGAPCDICYQFIHILLHYDHSHPADQRHSGQLVHPLSRLLYTPFWSLSIQLQGTISIFII